jgi:hypothetical protein
VPIRLNATVADNLTSVRKQAVEVILYEQIGLQKISRFGDKSSSACQFQTQLIIRQRPYGREDQKSPFLEGEGASARPQIDFSKFPLVVEFYLQESRELITIAHFDLAVIEREATHSLLWQFEHVFQQVHIGFDRHLKDISGTSGHDLSLLASWNTGLIKSLDICVHEGVRHTSLTRLYAQAI